MSLETEQTRPAISKDIVATKKSQLGQFFTPASIARFMAEMFDDTDSDNCRLLDAGAGIGSLSMAFLDKWIDGGFNFHRLELDAFEIDDCLQSYLAQTLEKYIDYPGFNLTIRNTDFINTAADYLSGSLFSEKLPKYTHAILNPPYKKMRSTSAHRAALRQVGIETVNLYSAFVALSLLLLDVQGQLVAIIPRSFCNGLYYRPFRHFIVKHAAIRHMHLFNSRNKAFKDDDVLQENVIIRLERDGQQGSVIISTSTDDSFSDFAIQEYPFDRIISPEDREQFIHVPTSLDMSAFELYPSLRNSLSDLKLNVSTGPVVDFRVKDHLCDMPEADTVPLLYPSHLISNGCEWPKKGIKKPNAIKRNKHTEKWLYPKGFYCVARRFSSKEERRRVVAGVINPDQFPTASVLGFENHLNVFHEGKKGLPKALAYGIALFLNSTAVDDYFRTFNGHTQVNATDLKQLKYPSRDTLVNLGEWVIRQTELTQEMIDNKLERLLNEIEK